jgi:branched-chain amino acid transport system permease protein
MFLLEQVVNGLVLGGYYLLIALGLSLIFSVGGIVNLAHGAFYAFGAYVAVALTNQLGSARPFSPLLLLSGCSAFCSSALSCGVSTTRPVLSLLVTFGLAMMAEQLLRIIWGARRCRRRCRKA